MEHRKKWRRINPYVCKGCNKKRWTFLYERLKESICRTCARDQVPEGMVSLFEPQEKTYE